MNEPLAMLLCERGVITAQVAQRLEAIRYRHAVVKAAELVAIAESQKAMVVLVDVEGLPESAVAAIAQLRANPTTSHIPSIAFAKETDDAMQDMLMAKGALMVVNEAAVLDHLAQLLDRALEVS